jgi:hypothetical protein
MFGWLFLVTIVWIATDGPEADPNGASTTDRIFALGFALAAMNVYYLAWRGTKAVAQSTDPDVAPYSDDCMFIPMRFWAYGFAAIALFLLIRSFSLLGP